MYKLLWSPTFVIVFPRSFKQEQYMQNWNEHIIYLSLRYEARSKVLNIVI